MLVLNIQLLQGSVVIIVIHTPHKAFLSPNMSTSRITQDALNFFVDWVAKTTLPSNGHSYKCTVRLWDTPYLWQWYCTEPCDSDYPYPSNILLLLCPVSHGHDPSLVCGSNPESCPSLVWSEESKKAEASTREGQVQRCSNNTISLEDVHCKEEALRVQLCHTKGKIGAVSYDTDVQSESPASWHRYVIFRIAFNFWYDFPLHFIWN